MVAAAQLAAILAVLGTGVVYGTDVFCAVVQRPAMAAVDERALVAAMGNVHEYGDRRLPLPGAIGVVAALASAVLAALAGRWVAAIAAAVAVGLLCVWLLLYVRISAPINRQLRAAAHAGETLANARDLQNGWDRIITVRATIQGLAVAALCLVLAL